MKINPQISRIYNTLPTKNTVNPLFLNLKSDCFVRANYQTLPLGDSISFSGKKIDGFKQKISELSNFLFERKEPHKAKNKKYFHADDQKKAYSRLSENEKIEKNSSIPEATRNAGFDSLNMAVIIKDFLDKQYGEGKWKFVSIGTSPAGVARALEFMDEDVAYIPISDLRFRFGCIEDIGPYFKDEYIEKYLKFLKEVGISKQAAKESEKKLIFYDYTAQGTTLDIVKEFIFNKTDLTPEQAEFRSLNKDLKKVTEGKIVANLNVQDYVEQYMQKSGITDYAGIPHLSYTELNKIYDLIKDKRPTSKEKAFNSVILFHADKKRLERLKPCFLK